MSYSNKDNIMSMELLGARFGIRVLAIDCESINAELHWNMRKILKVVSVQKNGIRPE